MAGFFSRLFTSKASLLSSSKNNTELFQQVSDNQPRNVYQEVVLLYGHTAPVKHIVQINKSHFATASDDCCVILWNSEKGCVAHKFHVSHTAPITCMLASSGCGTLDDDSDVKDCTLVTSSLNELVIWELIGDDSNIQEVCPRSVIGHQECIKCLCFLQQGILCSGGSHLCLWDIFSGKLLSRYNRNEIESDKSDIHSVLPVQGRNFGIIAASTYSKPAFFEVKKSTVTQTSHYYLQFNDYLLSFHNGPITYLSSVSGNLFATGAKDGSLILWSANFLNAIKKFECSNEHLTDVNETVESDTDGPMAINYIMVLCERYLFAAVGHGFKVFDVISNDGSNRTQSPHEPMLNLSMAHSGVINHMEFLYKNSLLLTASTDGTVRLWGSPIPFSHHTSIDANSDMKLSVEVFLGLQAKNQHIQKKKQVTNSTCTVPALLGELALHSGSVEVVMHVNNGIVTCGNDSMVFLWKNLEEEIEKRNLRIKELFLQSSLGEFYYDAC